MITLYCIRRPGEPPPLDLHGPDGNRVRLIEEGGVGAWVGDGRPTRDLQAIRDHDRVVRTALRSATPLPARFGTTFADEGALRQSLRERSVDLVAALDRVADRVEMGIRVLWNVPQQPAEPASPVSGREYLESRRREMEAEAELRLAASQLLDAVERELAVERSGTSRVILPEPGVAGTLAHLVHRQAFAEYRSAVGEANLALPTAELHVTGPWAPYSFV